VLAIIVGFDCGVTKPRDAGLRILNSQARGANKKAGHEARLFEKDQTIHGAVGSGFGESDSELR
jgi:hypothetical protein